MIKQCIACYLEINYHEIIEKIQAYEAYEQNRGLRKIGKDYVIPFDEMLEVLCELSDNKQ